jgi:hypothetical protein
MAPQTPPPTDRTPATSPPGATGVATGNPVVLAVPVALAVSATGTYPARHGNSARELLKIQWDYAVAVNEVQASEGTSVKAARTALSPDEAFKRLAGNDPRPLLVVRECQVCNKTDNALLRPGIDNEKTIVLSRWFHCVKLPVDVVDPSEPFNALFPTNDAEHLFVSTTDGSDRIPLESDTSRPELWAAMAKVLSRSYAHDPSGAAKDILKIHDRLDLLDQKLADLSKERDGLVENPGRLDKEKLKKLDREIQSAKKDLDAEKASIEKLSRIDLKPGPKSEKKA